MPVAALGVTEAANVSDCPYFDGLAPEVRLSAVVVPIFTVTTGWTAMFFALPDTAELSVLVLKV